MGNVEQTIEQGKGPATVQMAHSCSGLSKWHQKARESNTHLSFHHQSQEPKCQAKLHNSPPNTRARSQKSSGLTARSNLNVTDIHFDITRPLDQFGHAESCEVWTVPR